MVPLRGGTSNIEITYPNKDLHVSSEYATFEE